MVALFVTSLMCFVMSEVFDKAKAIRFTTLNKICKALNCQLGDILEFIKDDE